MLQLRPADFNRFLNKVGQNFQYRSAATCPCIQADTGAPRHDCLQCDGLGWLWGPPVKGVSGVASLKIQRQWANFGVWEPGDVVLTIPSDSTLYAIGSYDRVVMTDSTEAFRYTRRRGIDDLRPFPVAVIERIFWLDEDQEIVEAVPPEIGPGYKLTYDDDPDNLPHGVQYSMVGRKHPEYYMYQELTQDRSHQKGDALPRRVVLRKFDLLGRALEDA